VAFDDIRASVDSCQVRGGQAVPCSATEDDPAVILFTSGTTRAPNGVTLSHRNLIGSLQSVLVATGQLQTQGAVDDRPRVSLLSVPLFHIGAIQQLLLSMVTGGTLVFLDGRFDAVQVLRLIGQERVKAWSAVPTMVSRVVNELSTAPPGSYDVSSLRSLGMGAAAVSGTLQRRVREAFPNVVKGLAVSYGLTEASGVVAMAAGAALHDHVGTVGRVLPTVDVKIEAPDEHGNGEILVRSPGVMRGYWGAPENPLIDDQWLRTGDSGRLDAEGFLYLAGRVKDVVIRGGENVSSASVEARLLQHPAVSEAAVVGLPHPDLGEEVGAAVVLRRDQSASAEELADFASQTLSYYEVPTRWWLGPDELPKTATGKVLKREVVALHFGRPDGQP
jgi:long-chain acyl-CoA synthetase